MSTAARSPPEREARAVTGRAARRAGPHQRRTGVRAAGERGHGGAVVRQRRAGGRVWRDGRHRRAAHGRLLRLWRAGQGARARVPRMCPLLRGTSAVSAACPSAAVRVRRASTRPGPRGSAACDLRTPHMRAVGLQFQAATSATHAPALRPSHVVPSHPAAPGRSLAPRCHAGPASRTP